MTERIQELAIEAGYSKDFVEIGLPGNQLKFAELIVKECSKISEDDITDGDACCTNTADRIARQIKKHFGVEE
jgi:hypothetical protein